MFNILSLSPDLDLNFLTCVTLGLTCFTGVADTERVDSTAPINLNLGDLM